MQHNVSNLTSKCIENIHHIFRLKSIEDTLSYSQRNSLNVNLDVILNNNPRAYNEYELFGETLKFVSALAVKWGIINIDNYAYRLTGRGLNVKLLDLHELNKDIFTMETLWLSLMIHREPLCKIVDDQIIQFSYILNDLSCRLINQFLSLNQNSEFNEVESIAALVASKKPEVSKFTGIEPNFDVEIVEYQSLKLNRGIFSMCSSKKELKFINTIKGMLVDFEDVYRQFERSLMTNLLMAFQGNQA